MTSASESAAIRPDDIRAMIEAAIPDARATVRLFSGDDHFEVEVVSPAFAGLPRVHQHRMVYAALGENLREAIHALALTTRAPDDDQGANP